MEIEPAGSVLDAAVAPEALVSVGALSLIFSTIVVACHLAAVFRRGNAVVFKQDEPLLLIFFYSVVIVFLAIMLAS